MAQEINRDYENKKPVFLVVLKGSVFFGADLLRQVNLECTMETIRAKSYGKAMQSSGNVDLFIENLELEGKDLIIIEDIVDSGLTIKALIEKIKEVNPASVEIASFLFKPDSLQVDLKVKYIGIKIPSDFVLGYGLDYAELGRNLQDIYVHKEQYD
jgi:hypoxanthine phosphoribosyltransferase